MKKNKILIVVLIVLSSATFWFIVRQKDTTLNQELTDFAIEDTTSVNKIFLADKDGNQITLTKQSPTLWLLNGKEKARMDAVHLLLYTMKTVEVRSPVGKREYDRIIKALASYGVKVEIYQNDKLSKTYYVGGATQDHLGTEMYLENSSVPFITHIPGFNGFLTPRYFTSYYDWRDKTVFDFKADEITEVTIQNKENQKGSFKIKFNDAAKRFELYDESDKLVEDANSEKLKGYLTFYARLNYEGAATVMPKPMKDSLLNTGGYIDITVKDKNGNQQHVAFYHKPASRRSLGELTDKATNAVFDADHMFAKINNDTLFVVTQYELFNKIFRTVDEFKGSVPTVIKQ